MFIKFRCPACNHKLRAEDVHAGRRATCGKCKQPVTVPESSSLSGDDRAPSDDEQPIVPGENGNGHAADAPEATDIGKENESAPAGVTPKAAPAPPPPAPSPVREGDGRGAAAAFITFNCPACGKRVGFPAHLPGTPARCPACKLPLMIPDRPGGESFLIGAISAASTSAPKTIGPRQQQGESQAHPPLHLPPSRGGEGVGGGWRSAKHEPPSPPLQAVAQASGLQCNPEDCAAQPRPAPRRRVPVWALLLAGLALLAAIAVGGPWLQRLVQRAAGTKAAAQPHVAPSTFAPAPAEEPKAPPKAAVAAAPLEPDLAATEPPEPFEISTAPGAPPAQPAGIGELLALPDKKQVRSQDDDDQEQPAKAATKRIAAGGSLEKRLEKLSTQTPGPDATEPQRAPEAPKIAARAAPLPLACEKCMGTKFLPRLPFMPYVFLQKDMPNPAAAVPWQYCPQCQHEQNNSALLQAEAERLKTVVDSHKRSEEQARVQLAYAETHHVTLHAQLPESALRQVAGALEKLAGQLEQATLTTVLCQTRPGTHELVILADQQALAFRHGTHMRHGEADERHKQTIISVQGMTPPAENMALSRMGFMFMAEATDGKAPAWLLEGFAAFCENAVTHKNLYYPRTNAPDTIKPGENWDSGLRRLAEQGKLPQLEHLFALGHHNMSPTECAASYSLVAFLFKANPRDFVRYVLEARGGVSSAEALDRIYGRNVKDMQTVWAKWVAGSH